MGHPRHDNTIVGERKVGKKSLIAESAEKLAENAEKTRNGEFLRVL